MASNFICLWCFPLFVFHGAAQLLSLWALASFQIVLSNILLSTALGTIGVSSVLPSSSWNGLCWLDIKMLLCYNWSHLFSYLLIFSLWAVIIFFNLWITLKHFSFTLKFSLRFLTIDGFLNILSLNISSLLRSFLASFPPVFISSSSCMVVSFYLQFPFGPN